MTAVIAISTERTWADYLTVRLLRRWTACRTANEPVLPNLVALAREIGASPQTAVAFASVFQLTEANLGRPLISECCCSPTLSADEKAVLLLLKSAAEAGPILSSITVPHGLPGTLVWACASVRIALGEVSLSGVQDQPIATPTIDQSECPFGNHALTTANG